MNIRFNGERLKKARIYRGLTVGELAGKVHQQRQTLSMYEINKSQPSQKQIEMIASILNFPKKFFYEKSENSPIGTVYFRSLLTTNKKYRSEQTIKMEFLSQIYNFLQEYIEFPLCDLPDFPAKVTPAQAARMLRKKWNLGLEPIDNLITVVEQHGILVTSFSTNTNDIDAFSERIINEGVPRFLIAYSNNKTSAARIHFDVAHELGHICLHEWNEDIEDLSKEEFRQYEYEANDFAAEFLLPSETFVADAESCRTSLINYKRIKRKWKVSIAAMVRRSKELGILSSNEYQMIIRTMQKRGQRKNEPLDDVLITSSPALLKTAVIMLLQENVFTPNEFMSELSSYYNLSINAEEIEYLLDLPKYTLAKNNIIDFSKELQLKREYDI